MTKPLNIFHDAEDLEAVLHQLAGHSSMCWFESGEFDSSAASFGVLEARDRINEILTDGSAGIF